jgi:RING finger protein 113A
MSSCKHYFCEACAIKHHRKSPKCFACGLPTGGIFNVAYDIIKKVEEKQKRIEELSRQVREKIGDIGEGGDDA